MVLEYVGTRYFGFQWQAGQPTIQGEVEKALFRLTGDRIRVVPASRTDTGVHAKGQVISFRTRTSHSPETFVKALNYYLPGDIAVKEAHQISPSFDVRRCAVSREYSYHILNSLTPSPLREGFAHRVSGHLDIEAMNQVCEALIGEHDFVSFTSGSGAMLRNTVRRVYKAEVTWDEDEVVFNIVASSFLPHQVRNTVGALLRVGLGRMSYGEFCSIMDAKKLALAGPTAPACGLFLVKINYDRPFEEER
ncbi:MAG: tRNA pseudouridine(38-40) synthase TruA [Chloroflexi bacterium]|nr:tRNA pseudouridine(38-40) synthase TruA [Chloroflexota bacterium]